jgi:peptidoglycan/LPS O-acetylase OafA/YrhL
MSTKPAPFRYRALDSYRFVAASLIVLFHYDGDFGLGLSRVIPAVKTLDVMVDFFFVLSGFVIASTYCESMASVSDYFGFLRRRVARILPLHLAILCVFIGLAVANKVGLLTANHPEMLDLKALPANALLLHAWGLVGHLSFNAPSWSISAEWLVYLIFPILLLASRRLSLTTNLVLVAATVAAISLFRSRMGLRPWTEATYDFGMLRAVPTFFLGVIFAITLRSRKLSLHVPWAAVHLLFLAAVAALQLGLPREVSIAMLSLVVLLSAMAEQRGATSIMTTDFMGRLGDASYSVYLIHVLAGIPVVFILHKMRLWGGPASVASAIATYVVVVAVAHQVYKHFENPLRRQLSGSDPRLSTAFVKRLHAVQASVQR